MCRNDRRATQNPENAFVEYLLKFYMVYAEY